MKWSIAASIVVLCLFVACVHAQAGPLNSNLVNPLRQALDRLGSSDARIDLNVRVSVPPQEGFGGVDLWATVVRPAGGSPLPTIVVATPYRRELMIMLYIALAGYQYNVMAIDLRGTGSSGDGWTSFDQVEQYDMQYVIDTWIPAQSWSDGVIGMIGPSYMAIIQMLTAGLVERDEVTGEPVHLKAIFPLMSCADPYRDIIMQGGNLNLEFIPMWMATVDILGAMPPLLAYGSEPGKPDLADVREAAATWQRHLETIPKTLGWILNPANECDGDFYDRKSAMVYWPQKPAGGWGFYEGDEMVIPPGLSVFLVGGWFDLFTRGTCNNYTYGLANHEPGDKALVIGEFYHADGSLGLGLPSMLSGDLPARWFDWKLRGIGAPFMKEFPVLLYVMGAKRWRGEKEWPLPAGRVEERTWYLSRHTPPEIDGDWYTDEPWYHWPYRWYRDNNYAMVDDPSAVEYDLGNPTLHHEVFDPLGRFALHGLVSRSSTRWQMGMSALPAIVSKRAFDRDIDAGMPYEDERSDEKRCLTFTTEPLEEDLEIAGQVAVTFWARTKFRTPLSQALLTRAVRMIGKGLGGGDSLILSKMTRKTVQWVVELNDVFPNGRARNITSGWLDAWHRPYDPAEPAGGRVHQLDPGYVPFDPFYSGPDREPRPIREGELYQYTVELLPTCNVFRKGHRLRISISGSDFPHLLPVLRASDNTIVIDANHQATVACKVTNRDGEGTDWKWIGDIDEHLLTHEDGD